MKLQAALPRLSLPRDLCALSSSLQLPFSAAGDRQAVAGPQAAQCPGWMKYRQGPAAARQDLTFFQFLVQNFQRVSLTELRDCSPVRFRK